MKKKTGDAIQSETIKGAFERIAGSGNLIAGEAWRPYRERFRDHAEGMPTPQRTSKSFLGIAVGGSCV